MNNLVYKKFHLEFFYELNHMLKTGNVKHSIRKYPKDQIIFLTGSRCQSIGILLKGEVKIEHLTETGTRILIRNLNQYNIFGEILLFSPEPYYPYDIVAKSNCEILFISKDSLLRILSENPNILEKYLQHIAESYHQINKLIKLKSQKTLRHKLAYYFLNYEHLNKENHSLIIKSKTELANLLGVERQSLFRELKNLENEGYLELNKKEVILKNLTYFASLVD